MKKRILFGAFLAFTLSFSTISCSSDDSKENKTVVVNPDDPNNPGDDDTKTTKYQHKVLIEDHTGAWCGWCPRVSYSIEKVREHATLGDYIIPVAIHNGDVMQIPASASIRSLSSVNSYPTAIINRGNKWTTPENNNLAQVYNAIDKNGSNVGIKISSNLTNTGGTISTSFKFSKSYENLKYSIFVLENGIIKTDDPQENYTNFYDGVDVIPNFVHNDVLIAISGTATGNTLGNVSANQEVSKGDQSVTYTLSNNNLEKVEVVVFITDNSGKVLNVQKAHANETVEYQILN